MTSAAWAGGAPARTPEGVAVLVVHGSDEAYGADRVLYDLLVGLRARGWRPHVMLPDDVSPGWLSAQLRAAGIPVERAGLAPARRRYLAPRALPAFVRAMLRARRRIRGRAIELGACVVHVNTSALLVGALLGRPGGASVVWQVHEIVVRPRPLAALFRIVPPLAAGRVVAVSDAVRRHLIAVGPFRRRIVTVRNGIPPRDPAPHPGLNGAGPLVAFVGRLNRWKGYEVFVEAVRLVAPGAPDARFVVAGDPPPGEEWRADDLRQRVAAAGLEGRLQLAGFVEDGAAVFDAADVVVVPSTWPEPFGLVTVEAMRAGCAVIASAHGAAPELIEDGRTGLLVPPGDAAALAGALARVLGDDDLRARLASAARERVAREFSVERMVTGVEAVYRDVCR